jgi:hypothetical protein
LCSAWEWRMHAVAELENCVTFVSPHNVTSK